MQLTTFYPHHSSATSPSLSDNTKFPYFSRTCVSDSIQAVVAAQLVKYELRWDSIYVIGEIGSYSEFGVAEFVQAATDVNLRIVGKRWDWTKSEEQPSGGR